MKVQNEYLFNNKNDKNVCSTFHKIYGNAIGWKVPHQKWKMHIKMQDIGTLDIREEFLLKKQGKKGN